MEEVQGAIRWAPKIPGSKIRLLYARHAAGLLDDELLDDVAARLWQRCRDIVAATDAVRGQATCPRCGGVLPHDGKPRAMLACVCGFQMTWRSYRRSFRDRELQGGNATPFFRAYVEDLPHARTASEKVILIDRVVHAAHVSLRAGALTRRALSNLIEGTSADVLRLLDQLAYGSTAEQALLETKERWRAMAHQSTRRRLSTDVRP